MRMTESMIQLLDLSRLKEVSHQGLQMGFQMCSLIGSSCHDAQVEGCGTIIPYCILLGRLKYLVHLKLQ